MSEADEHMPLEIWTDINGNATRTQFKGGVKYIRADAQATVEEGRMAILDINGVLGKLEHLCEQAGSQYQWATKHKLSPAYVSDVLRCKRMPGPALLNAMGMKKVPLYMTRAGT